MFARFLRPLVHTFGSCQNVLGKLSCGLSASSYLPLPPKLFREFSSSMRPAEEPEWLQSLTRDRSEGPKLFKWTASDVTVHNDFPRKNLLSSRAVTSHSLSAVPTQGIKTSFAATDRSRIYILGLGNIGRLFAASLARLPNPPPITLVLHRQSLLEHWAAHPGLTVHPNTYLQGITTSQDEKIVDFDVELWAEEPPPSPGLTREIMEHSERLPINRPIISNLIVTTKAQDSLPQVDRLRRYLGPDSTVLFAQNGMNKLWPPHGELYNAARYGVLPKADAVAKTYKEHCPKWLSCVVNHGVFSAGPFESVHASPANITIGVVGGGSGTSAPADELYLVQQILASPDLNARFVSRSELWVAQLEKLVVNSIINPLTTVLHCKNGDLFVPDCCDGRTGGDGNGNALSRIIDQLLHEASNILQSLVRYDPAVRGLLEPSFAVGETHSNTDRPGDMNELLERLSFTTLRSMLYRIGHVVKDNTSSMLQDVRLGKPTEIKDFNGWFVNMADHLGDLGHRKPDVTTHRTLIALVEDGVTLKQEHLYEQFHL